MGTRYNQRGPAGGVHDRIQAEVLREQVWHSDRSAASHYSRPGLFKCHDAPGGNGGTYSLVCRGRQSAHELRRSKGAGRSIRASAYGVRTAVLHIDGSSSPETTRHPFEPSAGAVCLTGGGATSSIPNPCSDCTSFP